MELLSHPGFPILRQGSSTNIKPQQPGSCLVAEVDPSRFLFPAHSCFVKAYMMLVTMMTAVKPLEHHAAALGSAPFCTLPHLDFTSALWRSTIMISFNTQSPHIQQGEVPWPRTQGFYCQRGTYLGSTELGGLDFAGDVTFGSGPELPEDPGRESCTSPAWFGRVSLVEVRRCSLTSFSRDLALCSARRRSNCFFRPGTALRWLSECV